MGKARQSLTAQVKPAEKLSAAIAVDLTAAIATPRPAEITDPTVNTEEEDAFLAAKKAVGIGKLKIQNNILEAELTKLNNDNQSRIEFSKKIFWIVIGWLSVVVVILILSGCRIFNFSDKILITLLTTTTINIIGLFVIVTNYLFNKSKST